MKNLKKVILSTLVLGVFVTNANAQATTAAEARASASARIVTAIQIEKNADLNFGNIIKGTGGTVTIDATSTGDRDKTGTITLAGAVGTYGAAKFTVTGDGAATYAITRAPAQGLDLELVGPGSAKIYASLVVSAAGASGVESTVSTLGGVNGDAAQTDEIFVGGTLTVSATQASGLYTIPNGITITVDYN